MGGAGPAGVVLMDLPARAGTPAPAAAGPALPAVPRRKLLLFRAAGEWFAVALDRVREVCPRSSITRVPRAPAQVLGVMNLRGRAVVLVDLPRCLSLPASGADADHVILFELGDPDLAVGVLADRIDQVVEVEVKGPAGSPDRGEGVEGPELVEAKGHVATLLDPTRVVAVALPGAASGGAGDAG